MEKRYTIEEVAEIYQVKPCTINAWVREGKMGALKLSTSKCIRIRQSDLEAFEKDLESK